MHNDSKLILLKQSSKCSADTDIWTEEERLAAKFKSGV